jgi:hypothetical protein
VNTRYRKQMRLRSHHARHGHKPWCHCPEQWDRLLLALARWKREQRPLPQRRVRVRTPSEEQS